MNKTSLLIISGMSGAGKSIALRLLEDQSFHCIDNLPIPLLRHSLKSDISSGISSKKIALAIDARNPPEELQNFSSLLKKIKKIFDDTSLIFFDASAMILTRRFQETKRKHPLYEATNSLIESIQQERILLDPIAEMADLKIDTSFLTAPQLREKILELLPEHTEQHKLSIQFISFGYKYGIPNDADIMLDVRFLPNPYWEKDLKNLTGLDDAVQSFFQKNIVCQQFQKTLSDFMKQTIQAFTQSTRRYLTVGIGCTGGQHRSVYLVEYLAKTISGKCWKVMVSHRDLHT